MLGFCIHHKEDGSCITRSRYQKDNSNKDKDNPTAFIKLNDGMDRRIKNDFRFIFKPYSPEELYKIYMKKLENNGLKIYYGPDDENENELKKYIIERLKDCKEHTKNRNGGFVEDMYLKTYEYHKNNLDMTKPIEESLIIDAKVVIDSLDSIFKRCS